jgi:hypothetical protein
VSRTGEGRASQAGRELDARIAVEVMGWRDCDPHEVDAFGELVGWGRNKGAGKHHIPAYSTDIAAAWEVVEKLGQTRTVKVWKCHDGYICDLTPHDGPVFAGFVQVGAETAPLAICRAALIAIAPTPASEETPAEPTPAPSEP